MKQNKLPLYAGPMLLCLLGLYGCAVAVVGMGAAGASAFAYLNGKLTKTYASEYHETIRASSATLEELKIPVSETITDELKTDIKAERPDGTPVTIEVVRIDRKQTQVSVRTGSLGVWDRRVSEQIHGYIDEALRRKTTGEEPPAGHSVTEDVQAATEERAQPRIIEEDLTESPRGPAPTQAAQMLADSVFIIFFEQNSNALSPKAMEKLDRLFEILRQNSEAEITINGYSDSTGSARYNNMISEIRANAVKSYLIGKGVAPSRMTALGHGSRKFIGSNKNAEGRQLNRRVEIELVHP